MLPLAEGEPREGLTLAQAVVTTVALPVPESMLEHVCVQARGVGY